jgi:hypothetical protein
LVEKELKYGPNSRICSRVMDSPTASWQDTMQIRDKKQVNQAAMKAVCTVEFGYAC